MQQLEWDVRGIALCIADCHWTAESLRSALAPLLEPGGPDAHDIARRLLADNPVRSPPIDALTRQLLTHRPLQLWLHSAPARLLRPAPPAMQAAAPPLEALSLPQIPDRRRLAGWLGLDAGELDWFADRQRRATDDPQPLRHYRYRWIERRGGNPRLLEIPKPRLKRLQRRILDELLYLVPLHPDAHGFRRQRSTLTAASPHCARSTLLRLDLRDYFHSVDYPRVRGVFRSLGYPENVAATLAGLCTHRTRSAPGPAGHAPAKIGRHLPQGAPTSPYLANLCSWRLDARLAGLAAKNGLTYSRYADDIALSGPRGFGAAADFFAAVVGAIALEEGFALNHRKTRCNTAATRQRFCGIVVNAHPNMPRDEYDRLKATLHNCVRFGPGAQNRAGHADFRAHLAGRIGQLRHVNRRRAAKLHALFERIDWAG